MAARKTTATTAHKPAPEYLRRNEAGEYLKAKYGFGAPRWLAKLATLGGGPEMVYADTIPLYPVPGLDAWAVGKLTAPVASTSAPRHPAEVSVSTAA